MEEIMRGKEGVADFNLAVVIEKMVEAVLYRHACKRAAAIAGVLNFLLEENALNPVNLSGRIADLGTGIGGGALAESLLGAKEIVGVDDLKGEIEDIEFGVTQPSRTVFDHSGFTHVVQSVQEFLPAQPKESLDLITVFKISPRFPSPGELCQMSYPFLKPGGQIIVDGIDGTMISLGEQKRLLDENGQQPTEVVFKEENKPWWRIDQFWGRQFFLPVLKVADHKILEKRRELVFLPEASENFTDREVFIATKL